MDSLTRHRVRIGRVAGLTALVLFAVHFVSIGLGPGNILHGNATTQSAIAYAAQHGRLLTLQGLLDGLGNTLLGILIVLLIAVAGADGILPRIAYVFAAAAVAVQWTHASILGGLVDLAHRGGSDAGVMALFTLGSTLDDADAVVIPIAMICVGWVLLRSARVPSVVGWLTLAVAAFQSALVVLANVGGPDLAPALIISGWLWMLGTGIALLIKPASTHKLAGAVVPATA